MSPRVTVTSFAVLIAAASWTAWAAPQPNKVGDWPQWRGPERNGISSEKGLLQEWPEGGPKELWKASGLGSGFSSLVIQDGRIFTMGKRKDGNYLIALSVDKGRELWAARVSEGGDGPNCTPTVDGTFVYALDKQGNLLCANAKTGKEVWRKNYGKDFGGEMMSGWGFSESPLVDGDKLLCTPGGKEAAIVALDKKTGKLIWKAAHPEIGGAAYSSIMVSEGGGVRQYVQLMGRGIFGVAADDGRYLWSYNKIANGTANIPTPIVHEDLIFCSTGYNTGAALLKLSRDGDGVSAEEVYFLESKTFQNHHGGMVLVGEHVYCGHGHNNGFPICIKLATGDVAWSQGRGPGEGSAAVVYADGNLYFRYENGIMALIEANPKEYREKGTFEIPKGGEPSWSHPVVAGGKLYLREQDNLMCYDIKQK